MCGFVGAISDRKINISKATNSIAHRGPDDAGYFTKENLSLGHRRLSILDLSENGHQPMKTEGGDILIVYNGEIYNHLEIRSKLKGKYHFKSTSDTETLLYAYKEYGTDIFKKLNGIFAFAIVDNNKKQLILCRDQFGIKPLYIYKKGEDVIFGSEIKSLLQISNWDKSIDYTALINYLHFLWSPGEQTPFKFVKKILPGHYLTIDLKNNNEITYQKYYEIPFIGHYEDYDEKEWVSKVDTAFTKAVERQLLSDVPLGFFLSGGLDSSLIVAKAREISGKRLQCFTIDTDINNKHNGGFVNDLYYAKKVAKYLDVDLEIVSGKIDIVKDFDKMIWHLDEPQADAAPLNVLNICNAARQNGIKVLLGGAGGDDLFSGYRRHQALNFERYFKFLPTSAGKLIKSVTNSLPLHNATIRRIKKISENLDKSSEKRMAGYYEWLPLSINKSLFQSQIQNSIEEYDPSQILINSLSAISNEKSNLNKLLFWDMKYFLTDHNLNYTDKMSMAAGVETRVPFLDTELVELSTRIPVHLKMNGSTTKYILKKVAEKYLPKEVIYRPKTGFGAPVRKWILNDLDGMINTYLAPSQVKERGVFDYEKVSRLIIQNKKGLVDASYSIWGLLAIESWMRQFTTS